MAHLRLVEPTIDTYGSRRAWKRDRRAMHEQEWSHRSAGGERAGPSVGIVALASLAILAVVVLVVLLSSQIASAFAG